MPFLLVWNFSFFPPQVPLLRSHRCLGCGVFPLKQSTGSSGWTAGRHMHSTILQRRSWCQLNLLHHYGTLTATEDVSDLGLTTWLWLMSFAVACLDHDPLLMHLLRCLYAPGYVSFESLIRNLSGTHNIDADALSPNILWLFSSSSHRFHKYPPLNLSSALRFSNNYAEPLFVPHAHPSSPIRNAYSPSEGYCRGSACFFNGWEVDINAF